MYAIFIINKEKIVIECSNEDYINDICNKFLKKINIKNNEILFLYKGKKINQKMKITKYIKKENLKSNKINIFCIKIKNLSKEKLLYNKNKLKEIICPECGELCKIKFDHYKIILFECQNNHKLKNIEFENFIETQNIGKFKLNCDNCDKIEETFKYEGYYNCLECNKNLCIFCKQMHDNKHNIIKYEDKNYICNIHNERYISYCNKCNENICLKCEYEHKNENSLIYYNEIMPDINDTYNEEMKLKIEQFNNNIKDIIEKLNKIMNKIDTYYKIYLNITNNYYMANINYQILYNIYEILNYNNNIILNDLNEIIEEPDDYKKINKLIDLYNLIFNSNKNRKYKINKNETKIKIFGNNFVTNNKDRCKIIHDKKEYDLMEYFDINNLNDILEIELKVNDDILDMSYMFENCSSLIYFSNNNLNTNNVNNMSNIFKDCLNLSTIHGISKWETYNLKNMKGMFYNCIELRNLSDISNWKTNKVCNMGFMFYNCSSLKKLPDISKWNTNNAIFMNKMFYNCISLTKLPDISKWNVSNLLYMGYMFFNCASLKHIPDISKWELKNIENIESLFNGCSSLISIPNIGKWKINIIYRIKSIFKNCSKIIIVF